MHDDDGGAGALHHAFENREKLADVGATVFVALDVSPGSTMISDTFGIRAISSAISVSGRPSSA
jgi:hypothetical protein